MLAPAAVVSLLLISAQRPAAAAEGGDVVCSPGMNNPSLDLNGGPTMMEVADEAQCRALCEDHELCGAFVMVSRVHVRRASLSLFVRVQCACVFACVNSDSFGSTGRVPKGERKHADQPHQPPATLSRGPVLPEGAARWRRCDGQGCHQLQLRRHAAISLPHRQHRGWTLRGDLSRSPAHQFPQRYLWAEARILAR